MDARHHSVRFPVSYSWVPTKEEMEMLERYSSVWTEEDYKAHKYYTDFDTERCNAIQQLARTRLHLAPSIYLVHDVDSTFGQVYLAPVAGYKSGVRPTGLAEDPLRRSKAKPTKGADITKMLLDAKARFDAEQDAAAAALDAEHAKRCAKVRAKNAEILAEEERKWRQAGAPPSMAEKLRGVVKPSQPSWDEWQKHIVFRAEPTREAVKHEMELVPFMKRYEKTWHGPIPEHQARIYAEEDLKASKARHATAASGPRMPGLWQMWEVEFLDPYIQYRQSIVPY
jgi:hypothetical protein